MIPVSTPILVLHLLHQESTPILIREEDDRKLRDNEVIDDIDLMNCHLVEFYDGENEGIGENEGENRVFDAQNWGNCLISVVAQAENESHSFLSCGSDKTKGIWSTFDRILCLS